MIGLSPLPQGRPDPFQRKTVRPSSACHGAFSLPWGRSQSFASAAGDSKALFGPAFAPGAGIHALTLAADERLVGSLCKRHAVTTRVAPTACGRTVSGSLSLPCSGCFSPFPHGTRALSVSRECLALADGAAGFGQGSSDPALLRVQARLAAVPRTGLSPAPARLSRRVPLQPLLPRRLPYYPARASTPAVWAGPLSLAATRGVTLVFLSSDYWDVSVRRVRLRRPADAAPSRGGLPHSDTHGSMAVRASPWSFAACRVLHRLREPRHPPYALARFSLSLVSRCIATPFARVSRLSLCLLSLSHPVKEPRRACPALVENVGLEPTTPGLQSRCSSQLSQSPALRPCSPGQTRTADPHIISVVL